MKFNAHAIVSSWFLVLIASVLGPIGAGIARADWLIQNKDGTPLLNLIQGAKSTIDIEVYTMSDPQVQSALLAAQTRGVRLRIVQEPKPVGIKCNIFNSAEDSDDATCTQDKGFMQQVRSNGGQYVPFDKSLCGDGFSNCVEHGKMLIVDQFEALISSGNFDPTNLCDTSGDLAAPIHQCDRDYTYVTIDAGSVAVLEQIVQADATGASYDLQSILAQPQAAHLTVSPFSLNPLVQFISSAKASVQIEEQYLWQTDINQAITDAAQRGVRVEVQVEGACSFGKPSASVANHFQSTFSAMEQAGVGVRMFTKSNLVNGMPGYLHAKAIVVDGNQAWVGSVNGSDQAAEGNREFGFFFTDSALVQQLSTELEADYQDPGSATWQDSINCVAK